MAGLQQSARMAQAVVDGLAAHIAVVDERGCIVSVNERWREFARKNGGSILSVCEGANYLAVCRKIRKSECPEARQIATGIREVLAGKRDHYSMEYPCHSPSERRWFMVQVTPSPWEGPRRALIAHENITARVLAEQELRASEERYRQLIHGLPVAVYTCDARGRILLFNAAAAALWGREPVIGQDRWCGSHRLFSPDGKRMPHAQCAMAMAMRQGEPIRDMELLIERPDGSRAIALAFPDPIFDRSGAVTGGVNVLVDITALKVAENSLRTSERTLQKLSRVVEQSPTAVLITDVSGIIEYVNPRFTEVTGYTLEEIMGKTPRMLKSGEHPPEYYRGVWNTIASGQDWRGEFCNRKKNGELYWAFAVIAPIKDGSSTVTHFVSIAEDITLRRRATAALRENEERLRAIVNTVVDAIIIIDREGVIATVNPSATRIFGYTAEEMIGQNVSLLMPQPYRDEHDDYLANYHRTGHARIIGTGRELQARRKDGSVFPIELAVSEVDHMNLFTGVIRDITERKRLEAEILRIAEDERLRMAADLHDGICQELVGTKIFANVLRQKLQDSHLGLAREAGRIEKAIDEAIVHTRQLARGMNPVIAEGDGLMHALRHLAERTRLRRMYCAFRCAAPVQIENPIVANELYRIAQEAVQNAVSHSGAKRITIALTEIDGAACLSVNDNGRGLSADLSDVPGMGLRVMRYRAGRIGGIFTVLPRKPRGTSVLCRVPKGATFHA